MFYSTYIDSQGHYRRIVMTANDTQIGGDHYKTGGEEHWDRAMRLDFNPMQYIITKWAERAGKKGGLDGAIKDVKKIRHADGGKRHR